MKDYTIYINNNSEVLAKVGKLHIGISTDNAKNFFNCIKSVNNSLWLIKDYGKKAIPFLENTIDYKRFCESIGGREELKTHSGKYFPIKIYESNY